LLWMSLFEQTPCFTTDKHISTMNPRWKHILRRPNLQDLRRLKFTKTKCFRQKHSDLMNLHKSPRRANVSAMFSPWCQPSGNLPRVWRFDQRRCHRRCCRQNLPRPSL
jgi:hypothetical protein